MSITVIVKFGDLDKALRVLKKKTGELLKEYRERQSYRKPSEKRRAKRRKHLTLK